MILGLVKNKFNLEYNNLNNNDSNITFIAEFSFLKVIVTLYSVVQ